MNTGAAMITNKMPFQTFSLLTACVLPLGLACALLPVTATANQEITPATPLNMNESPPPWASAPMAAETPEPVSASAQPAASAPLAQEPKQAEPAASSVENWYRNRRKTTATAADNGVASLQAAAQSGDPAAQYKLALQYRSGDNPDLKQSMDWQLRAAQAGHVEAQYGLGLLYANGQYVTADNTQARNWFQQAANQGHVAARLALLSLDNGVPAQAIAASSQIREQPKPVVPAKPDTPAESPKLAALPAEPATPEPAPEPVARVAPVVEPASRPEPVMTAVSLNVPDSPPPDTAGTASGLDMTGIEPSAVRQSAESGDKQAQLMLGTMYEDGLGGLPSDLREAAFWYEQAAKQDYPKAQYNLGLLYEDGRGVKQNFDQAAYWYDRAAKAGFAEAQNNLGVLYVLGKGVKKDPKKAEKLFTDAASKGNGDAGRNLEMLRKG